MGNQPFISDPLERLDGTLPDVSFAERKERGGLYCSAAMVASTCAIFASMALRIRWIRRSSTTLGLQAKKFGYLFDDAVVLRYRKEARIWFSNQECCHSPLRCDTSIRRIPLNERKEREFRRNQILVLEARTAAMSRRGST